MALMRSFVLCAAVALGGALAVSASACSSDGASSGGPGQVGSDGGGGDGGGTTSEGGETVDRSSKEPPDPTPGCGGANVAKGLQSGQAITVGSESRTYELFVPNAYDGKKTYPLVFVFHGDGGTGAGIRNSFKLEAASSEGAIFVYPNGVGKTWRFDDAAGLAKDVPFIDDVAVALGSKLCVDKKRTFAVGFSRGAYFANMLGCFSTSALRGVIAHGGGGPFGVNGSGTTFPGGQLMCPQPPTAALQVIGQSDGLLGEAKKARDHWQRVNNCQGTTAAHDPSPCVSYDGCDAERPEIYCEVPGLGHAIWDKGAQVTWDFIASK
jgi:polyhydroxybutyrate depolymerase